MRALSVSLLAVLVSALPAAAQSLAFRDAGGARHVCGGVGAEERDALQALRRPGQLELLFASAKRGAFLAGIDVEISRAGSPPIRFRADGPTCLVEMGPGALQVRARSGSVERSRSVQLGNKGVKVTMTFPDEPWDGIRATEEEKRQARER